MKWIEVTVRTTGEACDAISEMLTVLGAYGITVQDPGEIAAILRSGDCLAYADEGYVDSLGADAAVKAYFAEFPAGILLGIRDSENRDFAATDVIYAADRSGNVSREELLGLVAEGIERIGCFLDTGEAVVSWKYVEDEDWANSWKQYYKPFRISPRVTVVPSWEDHAPPEGVAAVRLDPGNAFGTGNHATTAMCADMIDAELATRRGHAKVLDLGCGSGILSVIAAKLGAEHVDAVDIDPVAVKTAAENSVANGTDGRVTVLQGDIRSVRGRRYDLAVANIIADVIVSIAPEIPALLRSGGVFIASGIIAPRRGDVLKACLDAGLIPDGEQQSEDWIAFRFRAPDL